jgi:hypothetical protein
VGPFGKIGSVVEGSKTYDVAKGTVTRYLYVVDRAYGSAQNGVALYAYKRVDTITSSYDTTTFTLAKTVSLPLTGGSAALTFMGANSGYLVIGTSMTAVPVEVSKKNYAFTSLNVISQIPISITADSYGYVTVTSANAFFVVGPTVRSRKTAEDPLSPSTRSWAFNPDRFCKNTESLWLTGNVPRSTDLMPRHAQEVHIQGCSGSEAVGVRDTDH